MSHFQAVCFLFQISDFLQATVRLFNTMKYLSYCLWLWIKRQMQCSCQISLYWILLGTSFPSPSLWFSLSVCSKPFLFHTLSKVFKFSENQHLWKGWLWVQQTRSCGLIDFRCSASQVASPNNMTNNKTEGAAACEPMMNSATYKVTFVSLSVQEPYTFNKPLDTSNSDSHIHTKEGLLSNPQHLLSFYCSVWHDDFSISKSQLSSFSFSISVLSSLSDFHWWHWASYLSFKATLIVILER